MNSSDGSSILNTAAAASPTVACATTAGAPPGNQAPSVIDIRVTSTGRNALHLALAGEADHFNSGPLRAILARAIKDGYQSLVLDTTDLTFADSGLLAALAAWHRAGRPLHHRPSRAVVRLLLITHAAAQISPHVPPPPPDGGQPRSEGATFILAGWP